MKTEQLEKIKTLLQEMRRYKAVICSEVDPNDGDQGACYAYDVDPIDKILEVIELEISMKNAQEVAQVHSDINEKLFGYFKL
jgi:hypothetical protein